MYSGMTPTMVLRYLHRMLGTSLQTIELSDDEIMRVVFQESLPTFSKFFPYRYKQPLRANDSIGGGYTNVYRIPNIDKLEIIGVHRVWLDNTNQFGGLLLPLINDPFQTQLLNDTLSMTLTPTTFEYEAPNLVTIRPKIYKLGGALIEVKAIHPKHLKTIPMDMRDQFLRLCLDDVLISLYPLRHRFENYSTPYGSLQPFFEMVDNAQNDKNELLESWKENLLRSGKTKRIWIA